MAMVTLSLQSLDDWNSKISGLVELLDSHPLFRPNKWGPYEPANYKFDIRDIPKMEERWNQYTGFGFSLNEPQVAIQLVRRTQFGRPNWLTVNIATSHLQTDTGIQQFLTFATELVGWGDILYGCAYHETEFQQTNKLQRPTLINNKLIATGGMNLRDCLPGVYWANLFGELYVDWFGRERFLDLPCYEQQILPNSGALVLTGHSPLAYAQAASCKLAIRKHLGEDAFFDLHNPTRGCRSPFKDGTITS